MQMESLKLGPKGRLVFLNFFIEVKIHTEKNTNEWILALKKDPDQGVTVASSQRLQILRCSF